MRPHNHRGCIRLEVLERILTAQEFVLERRAVRTVVESPTLNFMKPPSAVQFAVNESTLLPHHLTGQIFPQNNPHSHPILI